MANGSALAAPEAPQTAPPLVQHEKFHPPLAGEALNRAQKRRRTRFLRRQKSAGILIGEARRKAGLDPSGGAGWAEPPRPAKCTWARGDWVTVNGAAGRPSHFSGTIRCGSISSCPVCSAVIRHGRSVEVQAGVGRHVADGGGALFGTFTLRHRRRQPLADNLGTLRRAWSRMTKGAPWKRWMVRLENAGWIRSLEVTLGTNGWHPHLHVLLLTGGSTDDETLAAFHAWLVDRWAAAVVAEGGLRPSSRRDRATGRVIGVDLRRVDGDGRALSEYLAKVQDSSAKPAPRAVGQEMTRGDFKEGRRGSRTPFELLDGDEAGDARAWAEYVAAMKHVHVIEWSKRLKQRLLVEDKTDDQVMDEAEAAPAKFAVHKSDWRGIRSRPHVLASMLDADELGRTHEAEGWAHSVLIDGMLVNTVTGEMH